MAEQIVQVTEGAGKKLHTFERTIGANAVQDEVVLHGEPYLASYVAIGGSVSVATANSHPLQLMAGSSLNVRVRRIRVWQTGLATTANIYNCELRRLTTAGTGGTVITPNPLDTGDAASGATAMTLPTVKGTEGVLLGWATSYWVQTISASTPTTEPLFVWDFEFQRTKPLIIAAGTSNGIAVKNIPGIAGAQVVVEVIFNESSFA